MWQDNTEPWATEETNLSLEAFTSLDSSLLAPEEPALDPGGNVVVL